MRSTLAVVSSLLLAGCLNFDQLAADCVARGDCQGTVEAPQLLETSPANQATDVRADVSLVLTFSKAMARDSVQLTLAPPVALGAGAWTDDDTTFTVQPQAPLPAATSFSVSVSGRSADGAALAGSASFTFTTQAAPDTQAPSLASTQPVSGAAGVSPTGTVTLVFSEAMEQVSVQLTSVPAASWGAPAWSLDGRTATFTPDPLAEGTPYELSVGGSDLAGNALTGVVTFSFTTGALPPPPDTTRPTVVATTPMAGATGVATSLAPTLFFSEPMKRAELLAATTVTGAAGIVLTTDDPASPTQLTLTHAAPLPSNTQISVTVSTGAVDVAGNALAAPFSFSFTTGATPDTTRPTIVAVSPADGGVGAPLQPVITVDFSEPMDPAATQGAVAVSMPAGVTGTPAWSNNNTRLAWSFSQSLPAGQEVRWQLGTGAKDLSGNALAQTQPFSFRTLRRSTVVLGGTDVVQDELVSKTLSSGAIGTSTAYTRVGDNANVVSNTASYRTLLGFSLSRLPSNVVTLESAKLRLHLASTVGTPIIPSRYVALQTARTNVSLSFDVDEARLSECPSRGCGPNLPFFTSPATGLVERDITVYVSGQVQARAPRLNFRLLVVLSLPNMPSTYPEEIGVAGADYVTISRVSDGATVEPRLTLTYLSP